MSNYKSAVDRLRIIGWMENIVKGALTETWRQHGNEDGALDKQYISSAMKRICSQIRGELRSTGDI